MKSKLAIWSFILVVMPFVLFVLHWLILSPLGVLQGETSSAFVVAVAFIYLAPFLGFILGIAALFKISKNPKLEGKWLAIAAIVIPVILLIVLVLN